MVSNMYSNETLQQFPSLLEYTLRPQPSLISGIPDVALQLGIPIIAYWAFSMFFHVLDVYDFFPQYRLHTPAEVLKRNHVSRYEVVRDVLVQQFLQTLAGIAFYYLDGPTMIGKEEYDIAVWALRLRTLETKLPSLLALLGVDSLQLAARLAKGYPTLASIFAGGRYATIGFASWELNLAKGIYWVGIPFLQFVGAIMFVDTWEYFVHRAMHMNKYLYVTLHSRHHRLYVPYAFGALYNHPVEGFFMDTIGTGLGAMVSGMSLRQTIWFYTGSTIKTIDDHCGYVFPWDPLQHLTSNNAAYHDIHHQSWGIKTNFSQPFFTFWDRFLGTMWTGGDVSARYERAKAVAQSKLDSETNASITNSPATDLSKAAKQAKASRKSVTDAEQTNASRVFREEAQEEKEAQQSKPKSSRRRQSGFDAKSLSDKVSGSLYGRGTQILHADGVH